MAVLLMSACAALPALASHAQEAAPQQPVPQSGTGPAPQALDEATIKAEMKRMVEQRKRELRPEYERRVREDGKPSADRWLRETAAEMGRRDGAAMRAKYGGMAGTAD
ncbi:hypothetical protein [Luteimonas arsenica]|uniref:hypothetical protein n=1 Tax=Luteimonas arsenica TaxID=1586242 RepID=UPI00105551F9|nr:hypothetical protein [Luteimonas arsenica]